MIKHTLLGLAVAVAPALAFAHSKSEATTPADGATVTGSAGAFNAVR